MSCQLPTETVRDGQVNLSHWNFSGAGPAHLDGAWDFWWAQRVTSPQEVSTASHEWGVLPGYWNMSEKSGHPAEGFGTYHVRLELPVGQESWSLAIPDVACSWSLTVNGLVLAESGKASVVPGTYRSGVRPRVVPLPPGQSVFEIYLFVMNLSDRVGGLRDSITVGSSLEQSRRERLSQMDAAFFTGGLLVMALFNIVIFFLQRQKAANLWLALFSFFIAVRTFFTGPRIVQDLWTGLTFELSAQIEYLCIFCGVATFMFYLKALFPNWWPTRVMVAFLFYSALFAVLSFLLPIRTYAEAVIGFYDLPLAFIALVFLGVCWWAVRKKHEDGPLVFFGMLFLIVGTLNDLVYQFYTLPQGYMMGRFLFVFLVFNTYILSRQLSKDFNLTQRQSGELRKLDKMKDDFLARVTHELRTPLNGMAGILDAFKMGDFGPLSDRQTYHLGLLESSSKRLLSLVESILDFSHLKKHQLVSDPRPILLKQTVDFMLPSFYGQLKPGVALLNRTAEQLPAALGDEVKLQQVIHHLVLNSLQHTQRGTIEIDAEVREQQILLLVKDSGEGIPAEKFSNLFSPFQQVADIDTRATGGLGLGLVISRQLVQQMGGKLELQSKEGQGTTAMVWLPICPPTKLQYFQTQRLERSFHSDTNRSLETSLLSPEPVAPVESADGASVVLIVDDEPVNLLVLRTFLSRLGYSVIEANSGPAALDAVATHVIDLVILDIMMPGMSGYQVCAKIRERFSAARLPVLLLTAKNQIEDLIQGYRVGASDFLTKPFQRDELRARMELHLRVSQAARSGMAVPNRT